VGFETTGLDQLKLKLQRLAGIPELANDALRQCADELRDRARDMAPIDYGDLIAAIQIRRLGAQGAGGRFVKGVSTFEVFVNNETPVKDPDKLRHGVDKVGEYAWMVHEHMGWASQPNPEFMPSEQSVLHGQARHAEAGGKFLERAAAELKAKFEERLAQIVLKRIQNLDFQA